MAEKLSESSWTGFIKKLRAGLDAKKIALDLDDGALLKALARLDKTDESKPQPRLDALGDVVQQLNKLVPALAKRKKDIGDKPFTEVKDKLYGLLEAAEDAEKACKAALQAAAEDEEESPALLTTKMVPLIREVRKGKVTLQSLVAVAGKETVVLLSRRAISPARGKLLKEQMANAGGIKFIRGECLLEENALTFVVQAQAGGLAKRLRAALLAQTQLRLKIRVRGESPDDVEADGEDEEEAVAGTGQEGPTAQEAQEDAQRQAAAAALQRRFEDRLGAMEPRVAEALRLQKGDVSKIRAVAAFAREKAEAGTYEAGLKALDMLEKLLDAAAAPSDAAAGSAAAANRVAPLLARWKTQRAAAIGTLKAVATEIAGARHAKSAEAIVEIQAVIRNLSAEPATLSQVTELQRWLGSDDVVADVCDIAEDIRTPLLGTLDELRQAIQA